jgi:hypothetical protein
METKEISHIIIAMIILFLVIGFKPILDSNPVNIGNAALFAFIIIFINIASKKIMGAHLDADVKHEIWKFSRYGLKPSNHFKKPVPLGVILPIIVTAFSLGTAKFMTILTYETTALKRRAAQKFGPLSFTEMTDWHQALIGAAGISATLLLSFVAYWIPGTEYLARMAAFYALFNMIPFSKLDGTQIYFGDRVLYYALAIITIIFAGYAIIII